MGPLTGCPRLQGVRVRPRSRRETTDPADEAQDLSCWAWDCPSCGSMKSKLLRKALREALEPHRDRRWRFLTLTMPGEDYRAATEASQMHDDLAAGLDALVKRLDRRRADRGEEKLRVLWVRELHKDGTPHLHALVDAYIPKGWLGRVCRELGLGWPRIEAPRDPVAYMAKYMTTGENSKVGVRDPRLKGVRRYGYRGPVVLASIYQARGSGGGWVLEVKTWAGPRQVWHWQAARVFKEARDLERERAEYLAAKAGLPLPDTDPAQPSSWNDWLEMADRLDRAGPGLIDGLAPADHLSLTAALRHVAWFAQAAEEETGEARRVFGQALGQNDERLAEDPVEPFEGLDVKLAPLAGDRLGRFQHACQVIYEFLCGGREAAQAAARQVLEDVEDRQRAQATVQEVARP